MMLLIPLGLRAKLYMYPWSMVVIVALTLGFSIKVMMDHEKFEKFQQETFVNHDFYNRSYQVVRKTCSHFYSDFVCDFFQHQVTPDDMKNLQAVNAKIDTNIGFDRSTRTSVKEFLRNLPTAIFGAQDSIRNLKEYHDFETSYKGVEEDLNIYYADHYFLTKDNINWKSLSMAQFIHSNWMHLLGNLFLLILFSLYLEQRVGHFLFPIVYLAGGYIGLYVEALFLESHQYVLGASANVMSVIGAFLFFFWKEDIEAYVNVFFVYKKKILLPAWLYVFGSVIAWDLFYYFVFNGTSVAVISHMVGFGVGIFCGFLVSQVSWVRDGFLFNAEQVAFVKAKKALQPQIKIRYCLDILEINRMNFVAVEYIFRSLAKYSVEATSLEDPIMVGISDLMLKLINNEFKVKPSQAVSILSLIPLSWNIADLPMRTLTKTDLRQIENQVLEHDWRLAIRLYDLYLAQNPDPVIVEAIKGTAQKVIVQAESPLNPQSHQNIEWLKRYSVFHAHAPLGKMIAEKYIPPKAS